MANKSASAPLYAVDTGKTQILFPYLPSLPTFEGLPTVSIPSMSTLVFPGMASISAASHTAIKTAQFTCSPSGTSLPAGGIVQKPSVLFVSDAANLTQGLASTQADSPASDCSTDSRISQLFVSSMSSNSSATSFPTATSSTPPISPALPTVPLPTPHIEPASSAPSPSSGLSIQDLTRSLSTISDALASLDNYHQSLETYIATQKLRRDALQAELERREREARRARLLAKLSRFERARASQGAALVRRKSSGARRQRRSRRESEEPTASGPGRIDHEDRVFSRSDQPSHEPETWRGINQTIAATSPNQEAKNKVEKEGVPMSREASSVSMGSLSKAAQGTWKKGSRLFESLRWKRQAPAIHTGSSA